MQNEVRLTDFVDEHAQNKNDVQHMMSMYKIKMMYNREEVQWAWLSVLLSKDFLVKGSAPTKKKLICAKMKINT